MGTAKVVGTEIEKRRGNILVYFTGKGSLTDLNLAYLVEVKFTIYLDKIYTNSPDKSSLKIQKISLFLPLI
jgi:hypothetical protein